MVQSTALTNLHETNKIIAPARSFNCTYLNSTKRHFKADMFCGQVDQIIENFNLTASITRSSPR